MTEEKTAAILFLLSLVWIAFIAGGEHEDANDLIRERLDEMGLHEEPIDIVEIKNIEINSIVYSNAGDY
jgi:hypothetical protein